MNNTLIITGGTLDLDFALEYIKNTKYNNIIAVDGGLKAVFKLNIVPNHIVGDFDTIEESILAKYLYNPNIKIHKYNPEKDFTDTYIAVKLAVDMESSSIDILGGTGTRLDHTLANLQMLQLPLEKAITATILNPQNKIRLLGEQLNSLVIKKSKNSYKYISLIPMTDQVIGISTKGLKYNLINRVFDKSINISLGVSNEILDNECTISIYKGKLLVIEAQD